jgi:hydroxyethylthiazole kinase-like uncharacterized protein yjeF
VPGAILLSGIAALRSGAGKLQMATSRDASIALGVEIPEAMVIGLAQTRGGEIASMAAAALKDYAAAADAILIGPGMEVRPSVARMTRTLLDAAGERTTLVLDAGAAVTLRRIPERLHGRVIITPHAGEMASLLDIEKDEVEADPPGIAVRAATTLGVIVALKGAESWIATPDGDLLHYTGGSIGLATSGSGDTLAGIVTGLAARGASPLTAAVWGVWVHGAAGKILARRVGAVGFLASDLLAEVPGVIQRLGGNSR